MITFCSNITFVRLITNSVLTLFQRILQYFCHSFFQLWERANKGLYTRSNPVRKTNAASGGQVSAITNGKHSMLMYHINNPRVLRSGTTQHPILFYFIHYSTYIMLQVCKVKCEPQARDEMILHIMKFFITSYTILVGFVGNSFRT